VYVIVIHDCAAGRRDWFAYGYPAYDSRLPPSCERNFYGRRWSWGLSGPVLRQPSSTQGGEVYGNACGGLSGGPVLDWRRKAVTSVVSRTYASCDAQGWGKIITAAIMGLPGGSRGRTNTGASWCGRVHFVEGFLKAQLLSVGRQGDMLCAQG
jgi:hypothetical protein